MKITINGGHCPGLDSGAVGATGLQEAVVVKGVMQRVAGYLRDIGAVVLEVQKNELYQITDTSNRFGADLFVSIHCNAAVNRAAQGTETYCYSLGGQGEKLAGCIQRQIVNSLGTVDRGVKTAGFYVLKNTDCPAVLVELAFISNPEDEVLLADAGKRDEFARAIARGITDYLAGVS
ncbi:N-acetylmuramoyl-L-alanine amidase|uniref:N-acetylmuramoyl-L-alanine amidase n=1 Tax=Dendrosporobacter quercicolus TaxID=146817 RepID=A0A1G9P0Z8_9FIRM|nr:N-acetylmuramoyl-L-alanine amidase [Dendrosporobacter quercicolus]NSL47509.1 N-acetylmuramoyl-L-alanine amidase [Dendrosporobacter quercicolus DSM 1736]SDL92324.1 N-acetylmuramoyl-L-alanine amidase [Dendrosporobacter quercicolus]